VQTAFGQKPQSILTMPILVGIDGVQKMSKSLDNYVGVTDEPKEMFGRLMRVPDEVMADYYRLLLGEEVPGGLAPSEAKRALGRKIVARFHDEAAAEAAEEHFDRLFVRREAPEEIEEISLAPYTGDDGVMVHIPVLMADAFGISSSEARRLLKQGGVKLDGEVLGPDTLDLAPGELDGKVLQAGKRRFRRLRTAA
jgi:tyrosyl-tRNA synthetase